MANRNTVGFGLIAQGNVGGTDAAGGQGKYFIDANYGVALFQGTVFSQKLDTSLMQKQHVRGTLLAYLMVFFIMTLLRISRLFKTIT